MAKFSGIITTTAKVRVGKTIPHPEVNYCTLRSDVEFGIVFNDSLSEKKKIAAINTYQDMADKAVDDHLKRLIKKEEGEE